MQAAFDFAPPLARSSDPSTSHGAADQGRRSSKIRDLTGARFGRLEVGALAPNNTKEGRAKWLCVCDCGKTIAVVGKQMLSGQTRSCGCLLAETRKVAGKKNARHGLTSTPTWESWASMRRRCEQPSHKSWHQYGGRGITVCERWQSFDMFLADMGESSAGLSLDRWPDMNGNYEPGNCRWATQKQQARNTRANRHLTAFGETKLHCEWAEDARCVVSTHALHKRLKAGWEPEKALLTPKYATRTGRTVKSTAGRSEREWWAV